MTEPDPLPTDERARHLLPLVYTELRRLAAQKLAAEAPGQTLQPTALVHEAYLRLSKDGGPEWENRGHFFAAAAESMRRILIDNARALERLKRGGDRHRADLDPDRIADPERSAELLELTDALARLATLDPPVAELVKLRWFAGLTLEQCAGTLGISPRTADSWWSYARAWLRTELADDS